MNGIKVGSRACFLAVVTAALVLLGVACSEDLGIGGKTYECTSNADCASGHVCVPQTSGELAGRSVCVDPGSAADASNDTAVEDLTDETSLPDGTDATSWPDGTDTKEDGDVSVDTTSLDVPADTDVTVQDTVADTTVDVEVDTGCTPGSNQPGTTPCGVNGTLTQNCVAGVWEDGPTCVDMGSVGLVMDVNINPASSGLSPLGALGSVYLFKATRPDVGEELWRSDGTDAGTYLLKDIRLGAASSGITNPVVISNSLYFVADDGVHGTELWKSDGTPGGTQMVVDLTSGAGGSSPRYLSNLQGTLYFSSAAVPAGVWKSDGTASGTVDVFSGGVSYLTAAGNTLFFVRNDMTYGEELWKSNGTTGNATMVKDIRVGAIGSGPQSLLSLGNHVFFSADDGLSGREIWKSDGSSGGTSLLFDACAGTGGGSSWFSSMPGGALVLYGNDCVDFNSVWLSDGSQTTKVSSAWSSFAAVGTRIVFTDAGSLWSIDGVSDTTPTNIGSNVNANSFVSDGSVAYFRGTDSTHGNEVWKTNGTLASTSMLFDVTPGTGSTSPSQFFVAGSGLFFSGRVGLDTELFYAETNGASAHFVQDILPGTKDATPRELLDVAGTLFFCATTDYDLPNADFDLWFDSATESTSMVADLGTQNAALVGAHHFAVLDGFPYFSLDTDGDRLWKSNWTSAGTVQVTNAISGVGEKVVIGDQFYFPASDTGNGQELWRSDGTAATTERLSDINAGAGSSALAELTVVGTTLFFTASDGAERGLYKAEDAVVSLVKAGWTSPPVNLAAFGAQVCFAANDGDGRGIELWCSDGTEPNTTRVTDLYPAGFDASPDNLLAIGTSLYFVATNGPQGRELWRTDGTTNGTQLVLDLFSGLNNSSAPHNLIDVGGTLFFAANDGIHGDEPWASDGTSSGTVLLGDLRPGPEGSSPSGLTGYDGLAFFAADNGGDGSEVWHSDGTPEGTVLAVDIMPGPGSSFPSDFTPVVGKGLYFVASTVEEGRELWLLTR